MSEIVGWRAAREAGEPFYLGSQCKVDPSHGRLRRTSSGHCIGCKVAYDLVHRAKPDVRQRNMDYGKRDRDRRYAEDPLWKSKESKLRRDRKREKRLAETGERDGLRLLGTALKTRVHINKRIAREKAEAERKQERETLQKTLSTYEFKRLGLSEDAIRRADERSRMKAKERRALRRGEGRRGVIAHAKFILKLQGGRCAHCGEYGNLHLDHITPLRRGGRHDVGNIQWLCAFHNMSKHDTPEAEYREKMGIAPMTPWDWRFTASLLLDL